MAIYGIGAYYNRDISEDFVNQNLIGIGWNSQEAPELHDYLASLKIGDIVYIKSAFGGKKNITIKGIGIIRDNEILNDNDLVYAGRNVKWLFKEWFVIPKPDEKNNVRSNTIYEEFHPNVLNEIISKIN